MGFVYAAWCAQLYCDYPKLRALVTAPSIEAYVRRAVMATVRTMDTLP